MQCDQACQEVSKNQTLCVDNMVSNLPTPRWPAMHLSGFETALPSAHVHPVACHCVISTLLGRRPCRSLRVPEGPMTGHRHVCLSSNVDLLGPPLGLLSKALLTGALS